MGKTAKSFFLVITLLVIASLSFAGQSDPGESLRPGRLEGAQHVARTPGRRQPDQHVTGLAQGLRL